MSTFRTRTAGPTAALRSAGAVGILALACLAGTTGAAQAASVTPTPVNDGNPSCSDFDASWTELKVEGGALGDGQVTDGTLTVTISDFQNSSNGTPGSFDWASNIGVDAVFVKAGSDKHNLYLYAPESTGDTDLGPQAGNGNGISHLSFCYDAGEDPTPTPEEPTPTPEEPTPTATPEEPTPTPEETPEVPEPASTPAPTGEVLPAVGTPTITLPPTDSLSSGGDREADLIPTLAVLGVIAVIAGFALDRARVRSAFARR